MTKLRIMIAALSVATAIAGTPRLNAHEMDKGKDGGHEEGKGEGRGDRMGGRLKEELGLTDAQADKLKAARKDQMEAMKALMEKQKLDVDSLRLLVDKKASDAELTKAIATVKADHEALQAQEKKQREAMAALLTPIQQAKMIIQMSERMGRGHGGMMGGPEHEGGPDEGPEHDHKD